MQFGKAALLTMLLGISFQNLNSQLVIQATCQGYEFSIYVSDGTLFRESFDCIMEKHSNKIEQYKTQDGYTINFPMDKNTFMYFRNICGYDPTKHKDMQVFVSANTDSIDKVDSAILTNQNEIIPDINNYALSEQFITGFFGSKSSEYRERFYPSR